MRPRPLLPALLALGLVVAPRPAAGQDVRAAVAPDTVTVGAVASVGVRVTLPADGRVAFPDSLDVSGDLENAGRMELQAVEHEDGSRTVTAVYPLTAWRPGVDSLPPLEISLEVDGMRRIDTVALPPLVVASVLPADTAGIEAKPPRDVIGPAWAWWLWALLGLVLLAALALLAWWIVRRRRRRPLVVEPGLSPRERAFRDLDAVRDERLAERPSLEPFYDRVSAILRTYLSDIDPSWGRYRTTTELSAALLRAASAEEAARLRVLLREADAVKFAAAPAESASARRHLDAVRAWIDGFPPPPPPVEAEPEQAA